MSEDQLTLEEKRILLEFARQALEDGVSGQKLKSLDLQSFSAKLQAFGASFVTLTIDGNLRGCIGALEPYQPLIEDVREHAVAAALQDYRFPTVSPEDLLAKLRPGIDGVILCNGLRRSTFLPQVWKKLPDPACFLDHLCYKLGAASDLWRKKYLEVLTYRVEEFQE